MSGKTRAQILLNNANILLQVEHKSKPGFLSSLRSPVKTMTLSDGEKNLSGMNQSEIEAVARSVISKMGDDIKFGDESILADSLMAQQKEMNSKLSSSRLKAFAAVTAPAVAVMGSDQGYETVLDDKYSTLTLDSLDNLSEDLLMGRIDLDTFNQEYDQLTTSAQLGVSSWFDGALTSIQDSLMTVSESLTNLIQEGIVHAQSFAETAMTFGAGVDLTSLAVGAAVVGGIALLSSGRGKTYLPAEHDGSPLKSDGFALNQAAVSAHDIDVNNSPNMG